MSQQIIRDLENQYMKAEPPQFDIGDTVGVHVRIVEGGKQRVQVFTGTVIGVRGRGVNRKFTVRRIVAGEGVERIFPLHSPHVTRIDIVRSGVTRRAKLYFLRNRIGKATRLKERRAKSRKGVVVEGEETIAEKEAREAEELAKINAAEEQTKAKAAQEKARTKAEKKAAKAKAHEHKPKDDPAKDTQPAAQPAEDTPNEKATDA